MNSKKLITNIIETFIILFAICNIGSIESTDILALVLGVIVYLFVSRVALRDVDKRLKHAGIVSSIVLTLAYLIQFYARIRAGLENPLFAAVYIILTTLGLLALIYEVAVVVIRALVGNSADSGVCCEAETVADVIKFDFKRFIIYAVIIFVCMIPFLFLNYPGVMTVDSMWQWEQAAGISAYSDHHPWMHTLLIKLLYSIGYGLTGDRLVGIAFYTVCQMMIMSTAVSYSIASVTERMKRVCARRVGVVLLLVYILYPYNLLYAVTMWKDVIFSAGVLVYAITIYRIVHRCIDAQVSYANEVTQSGTGSEQTGGDVPEARILTLRDVLLYAISSFVFCMFRHNGLYAWLVCTITFQIIVCVIMRGGKRRELVHVRDGLVISFIVMMVISAVISGPVMRACDVTPGDEVYNYCIPLQQVGRVVQDGVELTDTQRQTLEKVNSIEYIENNYIPGGADNMFCWIQMGDEEYFKANRGEYLKLWLELGIKHPIKYFQAYVDQTKGYYTPMNPEQVVYFGVTDNNNGLETKPIINGPVLIKINELLTKLYTMIPVYGILYSMGTCMLLLVMVIAALIYAGKYRKLLPILPVVLLQLTVLIAVPLVADMRYGYPLVLVLPYLAITSCDE